MKYSEEVAKKLNALLEKNYDSEKGYLLAAEKIKDQDLKFFFNQRAKERYDFGHELKDEIRKFREAPDPGTSLKSDIFRGWMNIRSIVSSDNEAAFLKEVLRGEIAASDEYNEILQDRTIPPSTANILMRQRNSIDAALTKVKSFQESKA